MKLFTKILMVALAVAFSLGAVGASSASPHTGPGAADSFVVPSGYAANNSGSSMINRELGSGFPSDEESFQGSLAILAGVFMGSFLLKAARKRNML
jgi:hypothetical protein